MPGPKDSVTDFNAGDPVSASQLNKIVEAVRALMPVHHGVFKNGAITVTHPIDTNAELVEVAIYNKPDDQGNPTSGPAIKAATWDKEKAERINTQCEFPRWGQNASGNGTFTKDDTFAFELDYFSDVTVTAGMFRVGLVLDGILFSVDCTEKDMPTNFNSPASP